MFEAGLVNLLGMTTAACDLGWGGGSEDSKWQILLTKTGEPYLWWEENLNQYALKVVGGNKRFT